MCYNVKQKEQDKNLTKECNCMKKLGTVLTIVVFVVGVILAFFIGDYMSDKAYTERRTEEFGQHISLAIETVENKSLALEGASEAIASNIWVAHEICDNPEISAELSNLWNTLVYEKDSLVGQENVLASQLKGILERYQPVK